MHYKQASSRVVVDIQMLYKYSMLIVGIVLGTALAVFFNSFPFLQHKRMSEAVFVYPVDLPYISYSDWECNKDPACNMLAQVVYFEARGEKGREPKRAVAWVVMNRKDSPYYPDKIVDVVAHKCSFEFYCKGIYKQGINDYNAWQEALEVAENVYKRQVDDPTHGSDHFLNINKMSSLPRWARVYEKTVQIQNHTFYKRG